MDTLDKRLPTHNDIFAFWLVLMMCFPPTLPSMPYPHPLTYMGLFDPTNYAMFTLPRTRCGRFGHTRVIIILIVSVLVCLDALILSFLDFSTAHIQCHAGPSHPPLDLTATAFSPHLDPRYHCLRTVEIPPFTLPHLVLRMGRFWIVGRRHGV